MNNNNNNKIIIIIMIIIIMIIIVTISKNLTQKKKLSMNLLIGQYLQNVHWMKNKIKLIVTEKKIVLKTCVKS